jgi:hypothetical protein
MIKQARAVLTRSKTTPSPDLIGFELLTDTGDVDYALALRTRTWEGMGSPDTVTVTLHAGNQLNPVIENYPAAADEPAPA